MSNHKENVIDGLPISYDTNYVSKTNKKCFFFLKKIKTEEIKDNLIICTEGFEFMHKYCVTQNGFDPVYLNEKDFTSMIKLKKKLNNDPNL